MNIMIVGGGKVGKNLALLLVEEDRHNVTLIEQRAEVAAALTRSLPKVTVFEGDGCDPTVLRESGAERAEAIAAVTGDDEDNLVVALLSKREFRIGKVAARINNPKNAWLFTRRMGVDVALDNAQVIARSLEADINIGAVVHMLTLREGRVTLVELTVAADSSAVGRAVHALRLPDECVLVAVLRGEAVLIPSGDTVIQAGDQIVAIARREREVTLAECFR